MKFTERSVIALFSIIAIFAFSQAIDALFNANGWKPMSASDWGTWVGAIGTVGALIGAIWIALEGDRKNRRAQMDLARITAAEFKILLPDADATISFVQNKLNDFFSQGITDNEMDQCEQFLRNFPQWDNAKLVTWVCLPDHVAAKLALARISIARCADDLELVRKDRGVNLLGDPNGIIHSVWISIQRVALYIKDAKKQCDLLCTWYIE